MNLKNALMDYYTRDQEIEVKLFKILGTAGILISIITGTQSILSGISVSGGLIDYLAAFLSLLLLWYVDRTKKYIVGYILTVLSVFMGLFSWLFFEMGGMRGSMPYFFAFSLVFTFLMFQGKLLVLFETIEILFYSAICLLTYYHPEYAPQNASDYDIMIDQILGIMFSGVGIGLIFLVYIAEYKKQQRLAEEASKAKGQFLANMSHEIRTPINMMLNMNEMVLRESREEQVREYAANAGEAGGQLLSMVNQILQFSRLEEGKETIVEESYNLERMLGNLSEYFEKVAAEKNLEFVCRKEIQHNIYVGDMRKVSQILTNLLSNAVKYTKAGQICFTIRESEKQEDYAELYFEVQDTGIGIAEKDIVNIFRSFERADLLKNRNIEGTGLGLAIAGNLAAILGTKLEVESEYGKGSRFFFTLNQPYGETSAEPVEELNTGFLAPEARILVVDDNPMNLQVAKSLLKKTMMIVDTADSAEQCYACIQEKKYHLILMDYMMPETDGVQALRYLKEELEIGCPVVVLTADVTEGRDVQLLQEGFAAYLSKPIVWKQMERCFLELLPADLIFRNQTEATEKIPISLLEHFRELLKGYDIDLWDGLKYMNHDLFQYARIAELFVKNIERTAVFFEEKMEEETLIHQLHSLKGNAGNIGAVELHNLASGLERKGRSGDFVYVIQALPLLKLELQRAKEGLHVFLEAFEQVKKQFAAADPENTVSGEKEENIKESLETIRSLLENSQQSPAVKALEGLMRRCEDPGLVEKLEEIKRLTEEIEFEDAEQLLIRFMEEV